MNNREILNTKGDMKVSENNIEKVEVSANELDISKLPVDEKEVKLPQMERADFNVVDLIKAEEELRALEKEHGIESKKKSLFYRIADGYFTKERELHEVNRKKYLWLTALTGIVGGHRFYEKRWKLGLLYLALSWTALPLSFALIDFIIALPMKADENGNIMI